MNFDESIEYLNSLGYETLAMEFGLEKTSRMLERLNDPQKNFLKVQVAGTNGKGSVCAFLDAICRSARIRTGLYTSPNILSVRERIKIDGTDISEEGFARHTTLVRNICEELFREKKISKIPTFFEQITAIAVSAFAEANVELAILETGLGGRLDSVTATNAEIIGITPIDYDHQEYLGESLTEIAGEKAAVIRRADQKVVVSRQYREAEKVILERCEKFGIKPKRTDFELKNPKLSLPGNHQIENAKVAVLLAGTLREFGCEITTENITEGLQTAIHKGRLEFYKGILFDGAHNVGGAKALRDYLDEFIEQPITMIFAAMRDKEISKIAEILFPKAEYLILTKPNNPRSMETADLLNSLPETLNKEKVFVAETVAESLKLAREISKEDNLICVTGSLYLVGEAQRFLSQAS